MPRRASAVVLTAVVLTALVRHVGARIGARQAALRARIVLLAADGLSTTAIAAALGIARGTALAWRARFVAEGRVAPVALDSPEATARLVAA